MSTVVSSPEAPTRPKPRAAPAKPRAPGRAHRLFDLARPREGWLALIGFAAASEAMAASIAAANWQPGLSGLPWLAGLAIALGYLCTRGRRTDWLIFPAGLMVGLLVAVRLPASGFLSPRLGWEQQVLAVLARLAGWLDRAFKGRIVQDDLLITLAVAALAFIWVYACCLLILRFRQAWLGAALLGAPLFGNMLTKPDTPGRWAVLWVCGSLLFILAISVRRRQRFYERLSFATWRQAGRVSLADSLALASGLGIVGLATIAFALAPGVPFNQKLNDLYQGINVPIGQARTAYDQLGIPKDIDAGQIRTDVFSSQLRFLGPFKPGTDLVLKVRSDRPRYQQGVIFDRYDHTGWTNTGFDRFEQNNSEFNTFTALNQTARDRDREQISEEVVQVKPVGALLFAAPQPLGASVPLKGDAFGDLRATQVIQPQQLYSSASLESVATADALSAASGATPTDIRIAFGQLPADMPERIRQLAQQQTAGKTSTFDKAVALETYVRTFAFATDIPAPPPDRDAVDWYLFEMRRGYSDYDSSAMAVLLRSIGIPARVVAGYTPGQLGADGWYNVTQKESHTWTQVYIGGYGWIDFEPTPDQSPFPRARQAPPVMTPTQQPAQPTVQPNATPTTSAGAGSTVPTPSAAGAGSQQTNPLSRFPWWLLIVLLVAVGGGWLIRSKLRGDPGARLAYMRIALLGTLLGLRPRGWQTPQEYGRQLQSRRRFDAASTETITGLYSAEKYGPTPLDAPTNRRAWRAWRQLKASLFRRRRR